MNLPGLIIHDPSWILGVDTWQGTGRLDIPALMACGVRWLWYRATVGEHDIDEQARFTAPACAAAGLPAGPYGAVMPYGSARAEVQARHLLTAHQGLPRPTAGWMVDFERAEHETAIEALRSAAIYLDVVEQDTGEPAWLYAGPVFLAQLERMAPDTAEEHDLVAALARRRFVVADYGNPLAASAVRAAYRPHLPPGWARWDAWQASGDAGATRLPWAPGRAVDVDWMTRETAEAVGIVEAETLDRDTPVTGAPVEQG